MIPELNKKQDPSDGAVSLTPLWIAIAVVFAIYWSSGWWGRI